MVLACCCDNPQLSPIVAFEIFPLDYVRYIALPHFVGPEKLHHFEFVMFGSPVDFPKQHFHFAAVVVDFHAQLSHSLSCYWLVESTPLQLDLETPIGHATQPGEFQQSQSLSCYRLVESAPL